MDRINPPPPTKLKPLSIYVNKVCVELFPLRSDKVSERERFRTCNWCWGAGAGHSRIFHTTDCGTKVESVFVYSRILYVQVEKLLFD